MDILRSGFLHDGRTSNLVTAIQDHASQGSEANQIVHSRASPAPPQAPTTRRAA